MMLRRVSRCICCGGRWRALWVVLVLAAPPGAAAETVILEDGRVIQAEKVETLGDRVRIEAPGAVYDLPRRDVMTILPTGPPGGTPRAVPPADVYRDLPQQMNERIRREMPTR
jgi:hypothetical protein